MTRFLVGLRSPVYLTAGIMRVSFRRFLLIDLICATTVVGTFFGLSYLFGQQIAQWVWHVEVLLTVIAVVALAGVAFYLWRRHRQKLSEPKKGFSESAPHARFDGKMPVHKVVEHEVEEVA